ncbi:unnamed protein product [Cladocopium goreaui]|uniref:Centrin-1 n=1 Tax=Cladocopium goreaui TaxID=2562237 RepID=A0A9P1FWD3_9DINO|nr:unnamed protein product [Cladocopium goreaui]
MDLRRAKHPAGRRINFYRTEADWSEETRPTEELVKSLHDGWTRRPTAWTRLLTLDRADRSFETTQAALLSRSSVGRSRSQFASVSCDDQARRTPKRPQTQATPGWSLRYCELLGVGPQPTQRRLSRREAVTKVPAAVERFQKQLEMDRSSGNSVFLATKSRGTRDPRVQRYQTFHRQESRMRARRRAIQADVMGQSRRCIKLAFRYMQMNHAERIDYLKKLFDSKMSKGGSVNRPEQYGISNEELKGLAAKMALPEQEVDHLDVQFRHYDFDGSGALDLEEVRSILADIGLSPQNREEKFEVTECINEKVQKMGCEEFEFEAFLDLLKSVRERLKQVQSIKCWRLFHEADVIGRDSLEMLKIMALLETKLGFYLRSSEENSEAINIFAQCDTDCDGCLNLDEFQAFVQKVRAKLLTLRRREEVQIAKKFDLEPEILHEFRSDLPSFWKIFERYSFNKVDQGVRKEDLLPFMVDIGLAPSNTEEPQCLPLIDVISEFAQKYTKFPALLEILRKGRLAVRASLEEDNQATVGSPLADIGFNLMMSALLSEIQAGLMQIEDYTQGATELGTYVPPIAWMDDVAICLTTSQAIQLVPLIQDTTKIVHAAFRKRGLTLNLDKGKSELIVVFRGPGAVAQRTLLFDIENQPRVTTTTETHILSMRVISSYRHLGVRFAMNLDYDREVIARVGAAHQAFAQMQKAIFCNKAIPLPGRLVLFQSLVLSRLLYGCAVWAELSAASYRKLEATVTGFYRRICNTGFWSSDHLTDQAFLQSSRLVSFRIFWARHRLCYLHHLASHGHTFHKSLLLMEFQNEKGWLVEVADDLRWMTKFHELPFDIPVDRAGWISAWSALRDCRPWRKWVVTAVAKHLEQEKIAYEIGFYHRQIQTELEEAGMELAPAPSSLDARKQKMVRRELQQVWDEGQPDYAWWEPNQSTELTARCHQAFDDCLQRWFAGDQPDIVSFHNLFFATMFSLDIPEFQAARLFIHWSETCFADFVPHEDQLDYMAALDEAMMTLLEDLHIWKPNRRAAPVQGPYFVIHLYAGRRREADFHFYMSKLIADCPQAWANHITVISLDTAIDSSMNVHSERLWSWLLSTAKEGRILGFLLGPPCETWSSARHEFNHADDGALLQGPRPLRHAEACWGIPGLYLRELKQLSVGSCLLLRGLWLCIPIALTGGAVMLEHPAPPYQEDRPSIFRTGLVTLLLREGWLFRRHTFQQWRHGSKGVKPTTLLFANNKIPDVLAEFALRGIERPTEALIGRNESGKFKTEVAKEYPSNLCSCFATAIWRHIEKLPLGIEGEAPSCFAVELADASARVDPDRSYLPDYQPQ